MELWQWIGSGIYGLGVLVFWFGVALSAREDDWNARWPLAFALGLWWPAVLVFTVLFNISRISKRNS